MPIIQTTLEVTIFTEKTKTIIMKNITLYSIYSKGCGNKTCYPRQPPIEGENKIIRRLKKRNNIMPTSSRQKPLVEGVP